MSVLTSKPKYNIGDIVYFNIESTYSDCEGKTGKINQKATGEVVGIFCDVQCVSNGQNNWQYHIAHSGMKHVRSGNQISPNADLTGKQKPGKEVTNV